MAGRKRKSKRQLKREALELGLAERRQRLLERRVFLALTLVTVVSPLVTTHWTIPAGSGLGAALSGLSGLRR